MLEPGVWRVIAWLAVGVVATVAAVIVTLCT